MVLIPLSQGLFAMVDDGDAERVLQFKWHAQVKLHKDGSFKCAYAIRNIDMPNGKKTTQRLHRFIVGAQGGEQVDHIDSNGLNDSRSNLRICTNIENCRNRRPRAGCSSAFKGVHWHEKKSRWMSYIRVGGRVKHLGCFFDEVDAARAYDVAAAKNYGRFARTNAMEGLL